MQLLVVLFVWRSFVGKTKWHLLHQNLCTGAFALCANGLVKLTPVHESTIFSELKSIDCNSLKWNVLKWRVKNIIRNIRQIWDKFCASIQILCNLTFWVKYFFYLSLEFSFLRSSYTKTHIKSLNYFSGIQFVNIWLSPI